MSSADADFYRLRVRKSMAVRVKVANLFGDALAFTITRGKAIFAQAPAINAGQQNRDPRLQLKSGTYFIRIESSSPNLSSYRLTVDIKKPSSGSSSGSGGGWFDDGFGDGNFGGGGGFGGFTCSDFNSQAEAQAYLASNPGLDGDGDGIPCESLPAW